MTEMSRILIVDSSQYFDETTWQTACWPVGDLVVGVANSRTEAFKLIASQEPTVVLVDLSHGAAGGLQLIRFIRRGHPRLPIIALVPTTASKPPTHSDFSPQPYYGQAARLVGAIAVVSKAAIVDQLLPTLQQIEALQTSQAYRLSAWLSPLKEHVQRPLDSVRQGAKQVVGAGLGLVGGACGVVIAIALMILIELLLPPSVAFLPGQFVLFLAAALAGLGTSSLFAHGMQRLAPHWTQLRLQRNPQLIPAVSIGTSLFQLVIFTYG